MRYVAARTFADPDVAARKLIEIANAVEAVQDGRISVELINGPFLQAGGTAEEYRGRGGGTSVASGFFARALQRLIRTNNNAGI